MSEAYSSYEDVSARLNQIVDEVNAEGVTLDEALALYEEAVKLGLRACDLSEEGAEALLAAQEESGDDADRGASEESASGSVPEPASGALDIDASSKLEG